MAINARAKGWAPLVGALVPLVALGFLWWLHAARVERVERISSLGAVGAVAQDAQSPTGYAGGVRQLLVPGQDQASYQWIAQTQQMLADGTWRVRQINYDNAPVGRTTLEPSPYRWWLALVAAGKTMLSGRPLGVEVEGAALWADPLLHVLLLVSVWALVAWRWGWVPAAVSAVALAGAYPWVTLFAAAQPDAVGLGAGLALLSVLLVVAGVGPGARPTVGEGEAGSRSKGGWFVAAGVVGAVGWWVRPDMQVLAVLGVSLGALLAAAWAGRAGSPRLEWPWRLWGLAGAAGILVAFLIEYGPGYRAHWRLEYLHPLYGLAWLGLGELLTVGSRCLQEKRVPAGRRAWAALVLGALAVAVVPVAMAVTEFRGWGGGPVAQERLTRLPDSVSAANTWQWIAEAGGVAGAMVVLLPVGVLLAVLLLAWRGRGRGDLAPLALALGPAALAVGLSCARLETWALAQGLVAVVLVVVAAAWGATARGTGRRGWALALVAVWLPGLILAGQQVRRDRAPGVNEGELTALIGRDLAHWLANRTGYQPVVALAPPVLTTSLWYHGGLGGLGTLDRDNQEGFAAAVRIAGATSQDEAQALIERRGVRFIIVPSWDNFLDEYARLGATDEKDSLVSLLHQWLPPRWLQPVAYPLPAIEGFEGQSVVVFEVVEVQDNAGALSRLAEYFVETGRLEQAYAVAGALEQYFNADLGAWVARAQVALATEQKAAFATAVREILALLESGSDGALAWDQRVNLAAVLLQARQVAPARTQVERCLAEATEPRLRRLTPAGLYRFLGLLKALDLPLEPPHLREVARQLLPPEARANLPL